MVFCQQVELLQTLKLYECQDAARLPVESVGMNWFHIVRSLENARPPSMITFVAPVPRIALIMACMPATGMLLLLVSRSMLPQAVPPSRQHVQPAVPLPRLN